MADEAVKPKISRVRPRKNKLLAAVQAVEAEEAAANAPPPAADMRGDPRADMRGDLRASSPREADEARAAARAAEIIEHMGDLDEGVDEFYIPPEIIPNGWTYEWKRRLLLNKEDPAYEVAVARTGWIAVPTSRHPNMMPSGTTSQTIERKGMVLMERPQMITDRAKAIDAKKAALQVRGKEAQLSTAPQGQFARDNKGNSLTQVKRDFAAMPIPK